jgi:putative ABC transport system permease protein
LGVVIGVASVVTVVGLIRGFSSLVDRQFDDMGAHSLTIRARNDFKDVLRGKVNALRFGDVEALQAHANSPRVLSPMFSLGGTTLRAGGVRAYAQLIATTPNYQDVYRRYVTQGRFLADADEAGAKRVVVIGEKLIETLSLQGDPIGQYLHFNDEWFRIVGVMERRGEIFGISQDEFAIVAYRTGRSLIGNEKRPDIVIGVNLRPEVNEGDARHELTRVLRTSHRVQSGEKDDFEVVAADQLRKSFASLVDSFALVTAAAVGLSLLVSGIGIMNIMLVSVTERTREIGVLKALGARRRDILAQFMAESVMVSGLGGAVGLTLGYALIGAAALLMPEFPAAAIPWWMALVALTFAVGVGLVFGVVPASRAAELDPIEALRCE